MEHFLACGTDHVTNTLNEVGHEDKAMISAGKTFVIVDLSGNQQ